ncbi:DNA topoisomerase II, partial [Phenoliferia sp. Uapishka_3]
MSSDEESVGFQFSDGESDDFAPAAKAKKAPVKKVAAAPKVAKPKAAPEPKAAGAAKVTKKKAAVLVAQDSNGGTSDDDGMGVERAEEDDVVADLPGPSGVAAKKGKSKSASETYVKLSQLEHVLKRPDTYIGSVEPITQPMWVYDEPTKKLAYRPITFVPGLYKIVDEILVNAADNKVRDKTMSNLKVEIDVENKTISVYNDGQGIPVEMHATENIWIPELIFGQLLTSSNYDDDEAKVTGGRNGYGAKLANIYSTEFIVETACSSSGKHYKQVFKDNMGTKGKPKITDREGEDWTKITFTPDLARFNMTEFDADTVSLIQKRVYDMAGITKGVKVFLNKKRITIKNFKAYVEMYTQASEGAKPAAALAGADPIAEAAAAAKSTIIYEQYGDRWEVAFAVSEGQFQQVSFCNSIATTKGGTHVTYIADQIVAGVVDLVKKKNKSIPVKPFQIKSHISVFVNCLVANPAFDSQTKENMTLGVKKFGSTCKLSEDFLKKVAKSGVIDNVLNWARFKQDQMMKKTDGHKRSRITGLTKLEDANNAGTKNGSKCTLILTEGDSAKALAVSGLNTIGRDNFGVFPLRGKLLNVREATGKALIENAEIKAIKEIMGLQQGKVYSNTDSLRYGSLMIMADQDHDGSHIKGLIINFLDYFFPSLLKLPNFLLEFITPIVKVTKAKKELSFFTIPEYETWKDENNDGRGWNIKYFKGLGTSTAADAKKYFGNMRQHRLPFKISTEAERALIDMAFNKKKADNRKEWLRGFIPGTFMDHNVEEVPIEDFINKELILFSMADNIRSIPSVVDGFKPGQRKVLFGCFKRKLVSEIKVGQLGGYISEQSAYHHGEVSLTGTIIGLAQDFVGSNNLNLLDPNGQFGTRLQGGKDAASARYIFTNVAKITRAVFHPADDHVLEYLNDDGQSIEPQWYTPIMPMVLVNGSDGIGTGWSSSIPNYNPADIVANVKRKIAGLDLEPMHPWYRGYTGTIEKENTDTYKCSGTITRTKDDTIEITELPVKVWTQSYKELLEAWVAGTEKTPALVKDYKEYHSDTTVHFIITLTDKGKEAIEKEGLEKTFKMTSKLNTSNMVCFDPAGKIKKYTTPEQILDDFYDIRLEHYHKRKAYLLNELTDAHEKLSNQARFIQMIITRELIVNNRKRSDIVVELRKREFRPIPKVRKAHVAADPDDNEDEDEVVGSDSDYDYLLSMAIYSLTAEKVAKLLAERDSKEHEVNLLLKLTAEDLWIRDLDAFSEIWQDLLTADDKLHAANVGGAKKAGKGKGKKVANDSDSEEEYEAKPKKAIKAAPKPKVKKEVPLPLSDDDEMEAPKPAPAKVVKPPPKPRAKKEVVPLPSDDDEEMSNPTLGPAVVAKQVVKKAPAKVVKKRASGDLSDNSDDAPGPSVKAKKVPAAKKQKVVDSDDDDDDIFSRPVKAPPPRPKSPAKAKKPIEVDLDDSDIEIQEKKPPAKKAAAKPPAAVKPNAKAAPKPKKKVDSDDEADDFSGGDDSEPVATRAPVARTARAAATKAKPSYKLELSDDEDDEDEDEDEEMVVESEFDDSE